MRAVILLYQRFSTKNTWISILFLAFIKFRFYINILKLILYTLFRLNTNKLPLILVKLNFIENISNLKILDIKLLFILTLLVKHYTKHEESLGGIKIKL